MALLQGFTDNNVPQAKRRKLAHQSTSAAPAHVSSQPEGEDEVEDGDGDDDEQDETERDVDQVDEAEGNPDDAEEPLEGDSSDDEDDSSDPFDAHFANPDEKLSNKAIEAAKENEWTTTRSLISPWRVAYMTPSSGEKVEMPTRPNNVDALNLKQKLKETASKKISTMSDVEKSFGSMLFGYRDILHCDRTVKNSQALRQLVCLHALNHVFK